MFTEKCKKMDEWSAGRKLKFMLIFIVGMCLMGYLLLVLAYAIPTECMQKNMIKSARVFENNSYPQLMGTSSSQLDNWTDALMLLNASHIEENDSLLEQAINVKRFAVAGCNPNETLINLYKEGGTEYIEYSYARYWHGYLIFLKPLLALFEYGTIRYILMFCQLGMFMILIIKLAAINKRIVIPTFLMWLFLNPVATMVSLQFSSVTIITFLAMIVITFGDKYLRNCKFIWNVIFFLIGGVTSYFDFLTFPLVSLCVPLILWIFLNCQEMRGWEIKQSIIKSGFWGTGYLGMWVSKWILGSIVIQTNVIEDALNSVYIRTSTSEGETTFSVIETIQRNLKASTPLLECVVILEIILLLSAIIKFKRVSWRPAYFVIFFYPFLWYLVATNHSYVHSWMTYREMTISVYAIGVWIVAAFSNRRNTLKDEQKSNS